MSNMRKVCIVGAGPAGFYAAQRMLKHLPSTTIDIIEKLPVPFGLVRFGVAPDHPEVKNVINTFTKTAKNDSVNFYGNITLGKDVTLAQLKNNYHAVLLAYGAERDKLLNIPNEKIVNVFSARNFVGWYNGTPSDQNLQVNLNHSTVAILGQGNVAMDVARILLTPIDVLKKTDITEKALATLSESKIRNVYLIGRRGPLQAAFTIKELRELIKLPDCRTIWREKDFEGIEDIVNDLQRPRKRITELMLKSLSESKNNASYSRNFIPLFFRSPEKFLTSDMMELKGLELIINKLVGDDMATLKCEGTEQRELLNCDLVFRSIGYRSIRVDPDINFDSDRGFVKNHHGRVLSKLDNMGVKVDERWVEPGLYVAGWLRTGPMGVILDTMANAFEVGSNICNDFNDSRDILKCNDKKDGFDGIKEILNKKNVKIVTWTDWEKIDKYEMERGSKLGKPREKVCNVKNLLDVCS